MIKTTFSYNRYRTQNKWLLSQQSKQKRNKRKIGIFTAMFVMPFLRFPNHTPKLKAPYQTQSAWEESLLTLDITYGYLRKALCKFFIKIESN